MSWSSKKSLNFVGKSAGSQPCSQVVKATYEQSVLLTDWWLIGIESNSKGRRLGVAGFPSRGRQAMRHFKSAAIIKRHDAVTLETEDGMTITITNGINLFKSLESGFPHEVCNCFLFGFPCYWKELAYKCIGKESTNKTCRTSSVNGIDTFPDDLPVTHVRDILMLSSGDSARYLIEKCICCHIPRKQGDNAFKDDAHCAKTMGKRKRQEDDTIDSGGTVASDLSDDASPKTRNESKVKKKSKNKSGFPRSKDPRKQDNTACIDDMNCAKTECNRRRQIVGTNGSCRLLAGDLSDDATPKTQIASKFKKSKDKGLSSADTEKGNNRNVETVHETSIDENSSRRTTRSMGRSNNVETKGGQI